MDLFSHPVVFSNRAIPTAEDSDDHSTLVLRIRSSWGHAYLVGLTEVSLASDLAAHMAAHPSWLVAHLIGLLLGRVL